MEMQRAAGTGFGLSGMSRVSALFWDGLRRGTKDTGYASPGHATISAAGEYRDEGTGCGHVQILLWPSRRVALGKSVPQFPCLSFGDKERMTER